jgi:hypothetical protein
MEDYERLEALLADRFYVETDSPTIPLISPVTEEAPKESTAYGI